MIIRMCSIVQFTSYTALLNVCCMAQPYLMSLSAEYVLYISVYLYLVYYIVYVYIHHILSV